MLQKTLLNAFKWEFYDLLGTLSIYELTENRALPEILERIYLILGKGGSNAT